MNRQQQHARERGQVLPLFALGIVAFIAAIALVLDGGFALAKHRESQNGSDAAAEAGAVVLAEYRSGTTKTNADVREAVEGVLTAMGMDVAGSTAEYTDINGTGLGIAVTSNGSSPPPTAWGVQVDGSLPADTFFARVIGINQFDAATTATAITGYGQPAGTTLLPITPPITIVTCDGQNNPINTDTKWGTEILYKVPLCKNGSGNVGWLDWTDASDGNEGGGKAEIVEQIKDPNIPPPGILIPAWHQVAESGNPNSKPIEDALRVYDGDVVLIPIFDAWCNQDPDPNDNGVSACPDPNPDSGTPGGGAKMWYHLQEVAAFQLCTNELVDGVNPVDPNCTAHGSYVNGSNKPVCDSGNGATSCLVGKFVNFIPGPGYVTGELDTTAGPSDFLVIQLIK